MANASKLKRKSSLGTPPPVEEASSNVLAPETAPVTVSTIRAVDGRSRRRTNRTMQLNLKVTPECDTLLRDIADREELLLAEVLEKALEFYNKK